MSFARLVQRLNLFSSKKERAAACVKTEMRTQVASLAKQGRSRTALDENLALLGIDSSRGERPKIVAVGNYRFSAEHRA